MKLSQPVPIRVLDPHHRGVGDVHPDFHNDRRDQQVNFAITEAVHDDLFLLPLHPPVKKPHAKGIKLLAQLVRRLDGRFQIRALGFLHQRIDEIPLPPSPQLAKEQVPFFLRSSPKRNPRLDGNPPRRHLVQNGQIKLSIKSKRQASGDGRGRHDQGVGFLTLFLKRRTLKDPETMLLVHDGKGQGLESDPLLYQRVRPDQETDRAVGRPGQKRLLLLQAHPPGEEAGGDPQRIGPAADIGRVLLGQYLRRRQQDGLVATLDGRHGAPDGDDRLSAPHVALEKTIHGRRGSKVGRDLTNHSLLRGCQRKQKPFQEPSGEGPVHLVPNRPQGTEAPVPANGKAGLKGKQLIEDQPPVPG